MNTIKLLRQDLRNLEHQLLWTDLAILVWAFAIAMAAAYWWAL